jgi:hypothetical protein
MAIVETITDTGKLFFDLKSMGRENFTYEGAQALMEYLEQLSEDIGEDIKYDPVALCCEYTEYADIEELQDYYPDVTDLDHLECHTTVIQIGDGGLVVADF